MKTSFTKKGNTMLIQLTQQEIKDAIHAYVVSEDGLGISLKGKTLTTNFTATRGEQGVIANLSIDKIGDTLNASGQTSEQALNLAQIPAAPVLAADTATTAAAVAKTEPDVAAAEADEEEASPAPAVAPAATSTTSLFG